MERTWLSVRLHGPQQRRASTRAGATDDLSRRLTTATMKISVCGRWMSVCWCASQSRSPTGRRRRIARRARAQSPLGAGVTWCDIDVRILPDAVMRSHALGQRAVAWSVCWGNGRTREAADRWTLRGESSRVTERDGSTVDRPCGPRAARLSRLDSTCLDLTRTDRLLRRAVVRTVNPKIAAGFRRRVH